MKNQVIKVLTQAHGKVVLAYWKSVGIDVRDFSGKVNEKDGNIFIYYGVIDGYFGNYNFHKVEKENAEIIEIPHDFLIGKKIIGFKGDGFISGMEKHIGEICVVENIVTDSIRVQFADEEYFRYNYTEAFDHFVDEEEVEIKDEIPTLGVGVLMMVSNDEEIYDQRFVIAKTKKGYLAWRGAVTVDEINFKDATFWKFAKPIEQKVILTKQDISDGKGVGIAPHLIEIV